MSTSFLPPNKVSGGTCSKCSKKQDYCPSHIDLAMSSQKPRTSGHFCRECEALFGTVSELEGHIANHPPRSTSSTTLGSKRPISSTTDGIWSSNNVSQKESKILSPLKHHLMGGTPPPEHHRHGEHQNHAHHFSKKARILGIQPPSNAPGPAATRHDDVASPHDPTEAFEDNSKGRSLGSSSLSNSRQPFADSLRSPDKGSSSMDALHRIPAPIDSIASTINPGSRFELSSLHEKAYLPPIPSIDMASSMPHVSLPSDYSSSLLPQVSLAYGDAIGHNYNDPYYMCICGKPGMSYCSGCKHKYYCGVECQNADWATHSLECAQYQQHPLGIHPASLLGQPAHDSFQGTFRQPYGPPDIFGGSSLMRPTSQRSPSLREMVSQDLEPVSPDEYRASPSRRDVVFERHASLSYPDEREYREGFHRRGDSFSSFRPSDYDSFYFRGYDDDRGAYRRGGDRYYEHGPRDRGGNPDYREGADYGSRYAENRFRREGRGDVPRKYDYERPLSSSTFDYRRYPSEKGRFDSRNELFYSRSRDDGSATRDGSTSQSHKHLSQRQDRDSGRRSEHPQSENRPSRSSRSADRSESRLDRGDRDERWASEHTHRHSGTRSSHSRRRSNRSQSPPPRPREPLGREDRKQESSASGHDESQQRLDDDVKPSSSPVPPLPPTQQDPVSKELPKNLES